MTMKLSIEHQGRETLHAIGLLTYCLGSVQCGTAMRDTMSRSLLRSKEELERLYAAGLSRDFLLAPVSALAPNARPPAALPPAVRAFSPTGDPATGLEPWQKELILRLERGLVRRLNSADAECIAWNRVAGTLSVTALPLLDELRAHHLTSNVFRRALPGSSPRVPRAGRNER